MHVKCGDRGQALQAWQEAIDIGYKVKEKTRKSLNTGWTCPIRKRKQRASLSRPALISWWTSGLLLGCYSGPAPQTHSLGVPRSRQTCRNNVTPNVTPRFG